MLSWLFDKKTKCKRLVKRGDKLMARGKPDRALKAYRKALTLSADPGDIYPKLSAAMEMSDKDWSQKDFVEFMSWTLSEQETSNPEIKQLHARLDPKWNETLEIAMSLVEANDEEASEKIESLVSRGEIGTRVLADMIRQLTCPPEENNE